ncbi:MAG: type IV pilus assembly protein PilM [Patescibacteria group bacterium]
MTPLAIDISDTIIRLVVLERRRRSWKLRVRAEIPVPAGLINDGDVKHPTEVGQLVKSLVDAAGRRSKEVVVTIPERHTFVKLISLPPEKNGRWEEAVATALTQHIPYNPDEVYWDWYGVDQPNSLGQPQVLVGAAPRTTVDEYLHLFSDAGLRVNCAEIESVAIARAVLGPQPPDDARIILDLGRTRSTLILVDRGVVQFSSTLRYAGRELNRYIADELHISVDQAERAKSLFGLDPQRGQGLLRRVLAPHIDAIADGIADVEEFFQEHFIDHRPITAIQISGSGALLRGIDSELRQRLDQQVVLSPSWIFQQLLKTDPALPPELGYTYTTAFGLALQPWFT